MLDSTITIFAKGFGIGFVVAAIVGPIAILCINKTLTVGRKAGFAVALGAALADATYGIIAGCSLTFVADFLLKNRQLISTLGGLFILYLGIKTFLNKPNTNSEELVRTEPGFFRSVGSIYFLTLANPGTILSFVAIFASIGLNKTVTYGTAVTLVSGVFTGSMVWFTLLVEGLYRFFKKMELSTLILINKISGISLICFAIMLFLSIFFQ